MLTSLKRNKFMVFISGFLVAVGILLVKNSDVSITEAIIRVGLTFAFAAFFKWGWDSKTYGKKKEEEKLVE
ncbi:hypothetical protein CF394_05020 [Tetzosporium hominis]|uniref:Uncharacterized protein n=1 Tax=Tetzosporium hominis TaxID=2020506 RepID=A0A264W4Y9_9BACL|nr:hypothetical protein [Tetzosporium hominis]OZS78650.1 hypothetical protein CF394_05020 [Tetzosporium hominis]